MSKKTTKKRGPAAPDDSKVAWALAEAAEPYLTKREKDGAFIAIGVGETFSAIDLLLNAIAREQLHLDLELVRTVRTWLDGYVGLDAERRLRRVVANLMIGPP